jgi:uroporphyrinogen decarboxylase
MPAVRAKMTKVERIERSLAGKEIDRPPVSFWYHFGVQHAPGRRIAEVSLEFLRYYDLDWLKLMNDYFYPMPEGTLEIDAARDLKKVAHFEPRDSQWGEQLEAVKIIARELEGKVCFIDTVFEPWQVLLRNLVGEHLDELVEREPQAVLDALDVITDNIIAYCKESLRLGSNGIFLSTFGSTEQVPRTRYLKFAKPFVMRIFNAIRDSGTMHTAHVHDIGIYVDDALDFPVPILSYEDRHPSNPSIPEMRKRFNGTIMGGLDKNRVTRVTPAEAIRSAMEGMRSGGKTKLLLAPGCSFPTWLDPGTAKALVESVQRAAAV